MAQNYESVLIMDPNLSEDKVKEYTEQFSKEITERGGNVLQMVCDLTIAKESAVFRQVGPMMGSYDAGYGTWYLEDLVGKKRAKEIWYCTCIIRSAPMSCARYWSMCATAQAPVQIQVQTDGRGACW